MENENIYKLLRTVCWIGFAIAVLSVICLVIDIIQICCGTYNPSVERISMTCCFVIMIALLAFALVKARPVLQGMVEESTQTTKPEVKEEVVAPKATKKVASAKTETVAKKPATKKTTTQKVETKKAEVKKPVAKKTPAKAPAKKATATAKKSTTKKAK